MSLFKNAYQPIGIDIGATGARMIQLSIAGETPKVTSAARCYWDEETLAKIERGQTPSPKLVGAQLRRLAAQGQFKKRNAVITLPREMVQIKNFRLPSMPLEDLIIAAEHEARALFLAMDDMSTVNVFPAGEVRQGNDTRQEIIAASVKRASLDLLVEQWHDAGFRPVGFDLEMTSLYRGVERFVRRRDDEAEVNVLVDIGHRRTMVLIGRGRELNFYKSIETGSALLTNSVARKLGITHADAATLRRRLSETFAQTEVVGSDPVRQAVTDTIRPIVDDIAREVALCLRYYSINFRGQRPTRVRIVGGEASDQTLVALLNRTMPVAVEPGRTIANADLSQMKLADRNEAMGDWSMAFGAALKFAAGSFPDRLGAPRTSARPVSIVGEPDPTAMATHSEVDIVMQPAKPEEPTHA